MSSRRERRRKAGGGGKWWGRSLAILGIGIFLLLIGGYIGVRRYLHSEGFRVLLSEQASRVIGIPGEFSRFRWDGLQVETAGFEASGDGPVTKLKADNLHIEIGLGGVTRGVWHLSGGNVGSIDATVDLRESAPKDPTTPLPMDGNKAEAEKNGWLPSKIHLHSLTVQNANARILLDDGAAGVNGVKIKVEPAKAKDSYMALVEGGRITTPWKFVPPVTLDRMKVRYADQEVFLTDGSATIGSRGMLEAEGEWNSVTKAGSFSGEVSEVDCAEILSADWAKRLTGQLATSFLLECGRDETSAEGRMSIKGGTLTALPFLDTLSAYADTRKFRVIPLTEAHADWKWTPGLTRLSRIVLFSDGLVRLEGTLDIRKDGIDGNFRLGLAPGTLATIPGAETDVFLPGDRGLLWTPLRITGTLDDPKEDLTDRLVAAAGMRMFDVLPETGQKVIKFTRQAVDEGMIKAAEAGTKAVEAGAGVIEKVPDVIDKAAGVVDQAGGLLEGILGTSPPAKTPPQPPDEKK